MRAGTRCCATSPFTCVPAPFTFSWGPRGPASWGPGTRIPALIVSPYAKKGFVDHTQYDTGSILRFITRRFSLPRLAGLQQRDDALKANGAQPMGDLTNALQLSPNL